MILKDISLGAVAHHDCDSTSPSLFEIPLASFHHTKFHGKEQSRSIGGVRERIGIAGGMSQNTSRHFDTLTRCPSSS